MRARGHSNHCGEWAPEKTNQARSVHYKVTPTRGEPGLFGHGSKGCPAPKFPNRHPRM